MDRSAENHYARIPFEEYRKIMLPMAEHCIVFHWAWRDERLEMIQQYLREQGLSRGTLIAWKKTTPGTGLILRDNCELLLVAARGFPVWPALGQQSLAAIDAPWEDLFDGITEAPNPQHSRKPEIFADEISRLWPKIPRQSAFAAPSARRPAGISMATKPRSPRLRHDRPPDPAPHLRGWRTSRIRCFRYA